MAEESGNSFSLLKLDGKPIEKLIEVVSAGINTLYKPRAIRKESEAAAYAHLQMVDAESKALLIRDEAASTIEKRARERLLAEAIIHQENIERVADYSLSGIAEIVSEEPVDADWRTRFFNKAQDVSSEEMQRVWGKILANEINQPGNVSLRTLDLLSNISKHEAEIFIKLCKLSTDNGNIFNFNNFNFEFYDITFNDILLMNEIGLLHSDDDLIVEYKPIEQIDGSGPKGAILGFGSKSLFIWTDDDKKIRFDQLRLTKSGIELMRVIGTEKSIDFLNFIEQHFIKSKFFARQIDNK